MDTPAPGVVKNSRPSDSEQPLPIYTPRSAGFGSPKLTQDSWTNPRRSQVRQIAKASFLDDDDDHTGEGAVEQRNNGVMADARDPFDDDMDVDSTASEPDSIPVGENYERHDINNYSPTPRASQAAHMPPQSAQPIPIPRSSRPDSSDPFINFEALKKHPPATATSKKPSQQKLPQKPGAAAHGMTATQGNKEAATNDTESRPKMAARKALANSKVKLSALELEGEAEATRPASHKPQDYDYSLPASNSNSPATSPVKKKRAARRPAVKKPEPKPNAREVKKSSTAPVKQKQAPSAGRSKQAKAASAHSFHVNPEVQTEEQEDDEENMELEEESSGLNPPPREEQVRGRVIPQAQEPSSPANEEDQDHITIPSDSTSSFPESDNTDDEDFECTRKMTPANARRRTRAAAAQSQARKEAAAKVEDSSVPVSKSQRPELRDDSHQRSSGVPSKAQPRKPTNKAAAGKSNGAAAPTKPISEPAEEMESSKMRSSTEKPKEIISNAERTAAANRVIKDTSHVEQDAAVPSIARSAGNGEKKKAVQASEPVKKTESSIRKPHIVASGPDGPKSKGKPHKTTATADLQSQDQQLGLSNGAQPVPTKARAAKKSLATVESEGSPGEGSEVNRDRSGRNIQPNGGRAVPGRVSMPEVNKYTTVVHSDADTTEPNYNAAWADATDTFVTGDGEDDTLVEEAANVAARPLGQQKHVAALDFANCEREVLEPLTRHVMYPGLGEHRTVLGEVDANPRIIPKDAPADLHRSTKRKLLGVTIVPKLSPEQQLPSSKTGFQSGHFPTLGMNSAALPAESDGPPMKKPRYNSARPIRVHEDTRYDSNPFGGLDSLTRTADYGTGENIFGPGREGKSSKSSAFVRVVSDSESTDRGLGQVGPGALPSSDRGAVRRQPIAPFHYPSAARSGAPEVMPIPEANQQMVDMGKRMRAALEAEGPRAHDPLAPGDEHGKGFVLGETKGPWPNATFEQSKTSELEERARAWKKAAEPYAETLGETMHKIVNVSKNPCCYNRSSLPD